MKRLVLPLVLGLCAAPPAMALRPFDGTDAAVARAGQLEFEFGYLGLLRAGRDKSLFSPSLVVNAGLSQTDELVIEGRVRTRLGGAGGMPGTTLEDAAVSLKHVFRDGILQDAQGPSVASECGVLVPSVTGERFGLACAGIVSQRVSSATVHLNGVVARNRDLEWEHTLGVIVEGPRYGQVEPVFEGLVGSTSDRIRTRSALAGAIVAVAENLSFDVALRTARVGAARINEIRAGLTWAPPLRPQQLGTK